VTEPVDEERREASGAPGAREGDRGLDGHEVVHRDVGAQDAVGLARRDDGRDGGSEHREARVQARRARRDDRAHRLHHPTLRQEVVDQTIEKARERHIGPVLRQQPGGPPAELLDLVSVRGLDQRFARRKVAVEGTDAEARRLGDSFERRIRVLRERPHRRRQDLVPVPPRVAPERRLGRARLVLLSGSQDRS